MQSNPFCFLNISEMSVRGKIERHGRAWVNKACSPVRCIEWGIRSIERLIGVCIRAEFSEMPLTERQNTEENGFQRR